MLRIRSLTLSNFKNVKHGTIVLSNVAKLDDIGSGADIVGIYGQNGSGKTSFIQALSVLKMLMSGGSLATQVREYVGAGSDSFSLTLEFFATFGDDEGTTAYLLGETEATPACELYICTYDVTVGTCSGRSPLVLAESLRCKNVLAGESLHEVISWSVNDTSVDADSDELGDSVLSYSSVMPAWISNHEEAWSYDLGELSPLTHWHTIYSFAKARSTRLEAARHKAFEDGKSFVFSEGMLNGAFDIIHKPDEGRMPRGTADAIVRVMLPALQVATVSRIFATRDMAVLSTSHLGLLALNYLPLASQEGNRGEYTDNFFLLDIDMVNNVPLRYVDELERALESISGVIGAIVPGLRITVARLGRMSGKDGEVLESIELVSQRGSSKVPLRNESEGIKKILSIVSLLVDVHTNPSTFFAIDEFDSGVFEYLLGEILEALVAHGSGQLVFTAHNLRPLEVLSSKNIWFTTTDENERYVLSKGVRGSNNLRKMYLRNIRLGGESGDVYVPTSPLEIDGALYDAGMAVREMRAARVHGGENA